MGHWGILSSLWKVEVLFLLVFPSLSVSEWVFLFDDRNNNVSGYINCFPFGCDPIRKVRRRKNSFSIPSVNPGDCRPGITWGQ